MSQPLLNALVGMTMLIGLFGVIVPVIPGTVLIAGAFLLWAVVTGGGQALGALLLGGVLLGLGQVLKILIPKRSLTSAGVPGRSILLGGLAGLVGFFVIPVVGLPIGFVGGVLAAEQLRLRQWPAARDSTLVAMRATGLSILIELAAALLTIGVWAAAVVAVS